MKKSKKLLLAGVAAMGLVGIAAGTVSTFAWYSASAANKQKDMVTAGTISVGEAATSNDDIYFHVAPVEAPATSLYLTNRAGRTYFRSGNAYKEILADDAGGTLASPAGEDPEEDPAVVKKQAGVQWKVWISTSAEGTDAPSAAALASIAGTYTVKVTASGAVKASTTKTTALVSDNATPVYNFAAPTGGAAGGALGVAANQVITLGTIIIANDGSVKETIHQAEETAWSTVSTAVTDNETVYYGIECTDDAAVATPAENGTLTPDVVFPVPVAG